MKETRKVRGKNAHVQIDTIVQLRDYAGLAITRGLKFIEN